LYNKNFAYACWLLHNFTDQCERFLKSTLEVFITVFSCYTIFRNMSSHMNTSIVLQQNWLYLHFTTICKNSTQYVIFLIKLSIYSYCLSWLQELLPV